MGNQVKKLQFPKLGTPLLILGDNPSLPGGVVATFTVNRPELSSAAFKIGVVACQ